MVTWNQCLYPSPDLKDISFAYESSPEFHDGIIYNSHEYKVTKNVFYLSSNKNYKIIEKMESFSGGC